VFPRATAFSRACVCGLTLRMGSDDDGDGGDGDGGGDGGGGGGGGPVADGYLNCREFSPRTAF